jgi:hypothetical protein
MAPIDALTVLVISAPTIPFSLCTALVPSALKDTALLWTLEILLSKEQNLASFFYATTALLFGSSQSVK